MTNELSFLIRLTGAGVAERARFWPEPVAVKERAAEAMPVVVVTACAWDLVEIALRDKENLALLVFEPAPADVLVKALLAGRYRTGVMGDWADGDVGS